MLKKSTLVKILQCNLAVAKRKRAGRAGIPSPKGLRGIRDDFAMLCLQNLLIVEPNRQLTLPTISNQSYPSTKIKNHHTVDFYFGGRAGIRTLDPLIKSQLLYQLSYASKTFLQAALYYKI